MAAWTKFLEWKGGLFGEKGNSTWKGQRWAFPNVEVGGDLMQTELRAGLGELDAAWLEKTQNTKATWCHQIGSEICEGF